VDRNEKFKDVTDEALAEQRTAALAAFETAKAAAKPTDSASVKAAKEAADAVDELDAELAARKAEAEEAQAEFDALQTRTFAEDSEQEAEEDDDEEEEQEPEEQEPEAEAEEQEPATVEAPAASDKGTAQANGRVATLARRTKRPSKPSTEEQAEQLAFSIVASAGNASEFSPNQTLTVEELGQSIFDQMSSFSPPDGDGEQELIKKFQTARIETDYPDDLIIDDSTPDHMAVLAHAADESRLKNGSLTAAGGWCAPSEVRYDLSEDESLDGIVSLPEVGVRRGGIRYTPGPQFADFYAAPGFKQTEAQAIAGTAKTSVTVTCPTFTEVRLDVLGVWIKVPILTEVGYPELTRRFASGTMTAHEHWKNADVIARLVALSTARPMGAAQPQQGSSVADALELLGLVADQRRQSQRLQFSRSMEVLLPFWVKSIFLNDLGRRSGRDTAATEAELNAYFASRNLAVQWLYDWQVLPSAAGDMTYPSTYNALVYPAGTFVKGTSPVIKLGAIYDAASLATNEYTGSFTEEGLLVAKMKLGSDYLTGLPTCAAGRTGANDLDCTA
jgi:hypothetical protein